MAGPGVRYWEIGRALARAGCGVTIAAAAGSAAIDGEPSVTVVVADQASVMERASRVVSVIVTGGALREHSSLASLDIPIVVDLYDPFLFENLHRFGLTPDGWHSLADGRDALNGLLARGDFFLCASDRQRDLYLGMLVAAGRINPATYADSPTLERLIGIVPFGLPPTAPERIPELRSSVPGIRDDSRLIVWNGGLWDWFDPDTAIRAVASLARERNDVQLLFLGTRHPNPAVGEPERGRQARQLARELDPDGRAIVFRDWTPYDERGGWLREASAAIALHADGIETRYAWRTRLLDCLWAHVPAIVSQGDALGDAMSSAGLARSVLVGDVVGTAEAIVATIAERDAVFPEQWDAFAAPFRWDRAVGPLAAFLRNPRRAADLPVGAMPDGARTPRAVERTRPNRLARVLSGLTRGRS